jgi:hypothetical protein
MAVAYDSVRGKSVLRLLVFIRPEKRPVIVDAEKIAFGGFLDVSGNNLLSSLRRFLTFLLEKNSSIMIDEETHAFLKGGRPSEKGKDIDALATALAALVPAEAAGGKAIEPQSPAAPLQPAVATHASHDPARVFIADPTGKSAVETPPMEHASDEPILEKGKIRRIAIVYFTLSLFFCLGLISFISQIGKEAGSSRSNWGPSISGPVAGQFFQESPALKRQRELLEYNRKGAKLTAVIGLIICALLAIFFFRKARRYWTTYQELD